MGVSKYLGVRWHRNQGAWHAQIGPKRTYLGTFYREIEAAHAYDEAAREMWGKAARLNFPKPGERSAFGHAASA